MPPFSPFCSSVDENHSESNGSLSPYSSQTLFRSFSSSSLSLKSPTEDPQIKEACQKLDACMEILWGLLKACEVPRACVEELKEVAARNSAQALKRVQLYACCFREQDESKDGVILFVEQAWLALRDYNRLIQKQAFKHFQTLKHDPNRHQDVAEMKRALVRYQETSEDCVAAEAGIYLLGHWTAEMCLPHAATSRPCYERSYSW